MQQCCKHNRIFLSCNCVAKTTLRMKSSAQFFSWHWDLAGFVASTLCAIHCLTWPILLSLPAFASSLGSGMPWLEPALIALAAVLAIWALGRGWRVHRAWQPLALAVFGFGLIALGRWIGGTWEPPGTISGGIMVALSHLLNWRKQRSCQWSSEAAQ
jgi:hypothetical protein